MKKVIFCSNRIIRTFMYLSLSSFLAGCAGMFIAGMPIDADKYYPHFIGLKITPAVYPAVIINGGATYGIHLPHNEPYGEFVADVPEGTIITIEHFIRKYNVQNEARDQVLGRISVPGYSGLVAVGGCDARKKPQLIEECIKLEKYKILGK